MDFIGTEDHFTTSVPNETDKILVDVEGSIWNRKNTLKSFTVSVDGTDEVYASGDAIPLKVGVNKLTVTCVAAVGKDSTYTLMLLVVPKPNRPPSRSRTAHPYWLYREAKS